MTTFTMRLFLPLNLTPLSSSVSLKYHSTTISFSSFSPGRSPSVPRSSSLLKSVCGCMQGDQNVEGWRKEEEIGASMFGSDDEVSTQVPTQVQSLVEGSGSVVVSEFKPVTDVDYLQELLAIQQQGPRNIGFFGTRNMGFMHQELVEILSYAMVITKNHIFTSGASGTNAAVIKGALRAEKPELLTVILPQSLKKQPPESQELLSKVKNVIEKPHNDHLPLIEASRHYFVPGRSKFAIMLLFFNLNSSEFTLKWILANPMTTIPLVARVDNAGYVTWTSFHKCSKSSVSPFTTAGCSWKPVKKQRTSGRS